MDLRCWTLCFVYDEIPVVVIYVSWRNILQFDDIWYLVLHENKYPLETSQPWIDIFIVLGSLLGLEWNTIMYKQRRLNIFHSKVHYVHLENN